jgi:hypothetical protein
LIISVELEVTDMHPAILYTHLLGRKTSHHVFQLLLDLSEGSLGAEDFNLELFIVKDELGIFTLQTLVQ